MSPITSYEQGSSGGAYSVREGDTLAGLAERLWGDASLWWKIAEANGLTGQAALVEGQALTLPAGVMRATHNAQTFQPYDPSETLGDTAPTTLQPTPKKNKCGVFGRIFLQIVAIVVTVVLDRIIPGVGSVIGNAIRGAGIGAAANIVTQGIGVATGIQDKFSWNAVALSGLSAGISGGLAAKGSPLAGGGVVNAFARGATASALTQGIGVATGLQDKFSWSAVAAAGVGAGVGHFASAHLPGAAIHKGGELVKPAAWYNNAGASLASGISMAATRSLIDGTDFGDNLIAVLPDLIGQTIGGAFAASKGGSNWESQFKGIEAQGDADESLKSDESAYGPLRVDITRGYADEIIVEGVRKNPVFISNWSWTSDWMGRIDNASVRYAATARPTLPTPPSIGQQLYQTVVGNVLDQYNARQQMGFAMFDAAAANGRQNAQLAAGFDVVFNNLETLGLLAGGAINYVGSPLLAPIDAYVGRPIHTLSGGAFSVELAGDVAVTIGGMLVAPSAGAGRAMAVQQIQRGSARTWMEGVAADDLVRVNTELPAFDGTTRGILLTDEGRLVSLESGSGNPLYAFPSATHVEGKAALWIRENGSTGGIVFHNNPGGICPFCRSQISTLLPEGAALRVVPPINAVAPPRWTANPTTYVGNSTIPRQRP